MPTPDASALWIHAIRLIDGAGEAVLEDAVVATDTAGVITYAGPAGQAPPRPAGSTAIDGRGGTLVPGLFDCHTHLGVPSDRSIIEVALLSDPVVSTLRTAERLRSTLEAGVTSVRDLGGLPAGFRDAVDSGLIVGPRVQTSVGVISHTGGHADDTMPGGASLGLDYCTLADDVSGVRLSARRMMRAGADLVKICTSGGISSANDDPDDEDLLDEEVSAAVDEARRHGGRGVAAHAQGRGGVLAAIRGGVRSVEHGFGIDDEGCDLIGEAGSFLVPTLATAFEPLTAGTMPPWRYDKKLRWQERTKTNIAAAIARGVKIAAGTDAGSTPHGANLRELGYLVELGMSPMAAIHAATSVSADLLGVAEEVGTLRPGLAADLVLCDGDPSIDIEVLGDPEKIVLVARQGVVYKNTLPAAPTTAVPARVDEDRVIA